MTKSKDLLARRAAVVPRGVGQFAGPVTAVSAEGATITDADGQTFIDFTGGIGVMNVGHGQEAVVNAIQEQAARLCHTCIHIATYEPYIALCERLVSLLPHGDRTKVMLINSGAEAVENAIKIARQATGRSAVICYTEAFHGRTLLCSTLTSKTAYKIGCGPFAPEIYRLPFPNRYRYGEGLDEDAFVDHELRRLEQTFVNTVRADDVAAVILEIVQGEGGFSVAPEVYLRGLRRICDEHGIVLIFDEVQSGFCRTGCWAAYQHFGVVPDLSTWAKSMGAGMPISAVIGRAEIMDAALPGTLGGTYGGNPVSCAAALAAIDTMEKLDLNRCAAAIGERIRNRFLALQSKCPAIVDVRGLGAMQAIELVENGEPATQLVRRIIDDCRQCGLLIIPAGSHGNVLRILSPLVITDELLDRGLDILEDAFVRLACRPQPQAPSPAPVASSTGAP